YILLVQLGTEVHTFFFFQAEDGIRDDLVTGVQTCALPIFAGDIGDGIPAIVGPESSLQRESDRQQQADAVWVDGRTARRQMVNRSEERRVGRACRSGGEPRHHTTKERRVRKEVESREHEM